MRLKGYFFSKSRMAANLSTKGFTMMEMLWAIALMGTIMVVVAGVFVHGMNAIKKGRYQMWAFSVIEEKIIQFRKLPLNDPNIPASTIRDTLEANSVDNNLSWGALSPAINVQGRKDLNFLKYNYQIKIEEYDPGSSLNIKKITMDINWKEPDGRQEAVKSITFITKPARY
jgi:prepilin-type N-terminal cleavage/methylation domain-containing protein